MINGSLYEHQQRCVDLVLNEGHDKYAFYLDTGTGKTITALELIERLGPGLRWLVITPKAVIESWLSDAEKHFPDLDIATIARYKKASYYKQFHKGKKADAVDYITQQMQVVIVNPEMVITRNVKGANDKKKKVKGKIDPDKFYGLIFDESVRLINPKSAISKFCAKFSDKAKHVFLLSGEPAPNTPFEFFGQMRMVDAELFGKSFYQFKQRFGYQDKFNGWHCRKESKKKILEIVKRKAIFVKKSEVLDLPPVTIIDRVIHETKKSKEKRLDINEILTEDGFNISQLMKMRELANGFLYEQDIATGERTGEVMRFNNDKRDRLKSELQNIHGKVIIWVQFGEDLESIMEITGRYQTAIATGAAKDLQGEIKFFLTKAKYLIAHPKSIGAGVDGLQKTCSYMIFFSPSYSYSDYYQAVSRLDRNGQEDPVTVINLICADSIEEDMIKAIKKKQSFHEFIKEKLDWKK